MGVETGGLQRVDHLLHVFTAARLQHQLDRHVLRRQQGEGALVVDLVDVGAGFGDDGRDARQVAGYIARADLEALRSRGAA